MSKRRKQFPGATAYFDRHGRRRWRYRAKGFSADLGPDYGSDEFVRRYEAALQTHRLPGRVGMSRTRPGSLSALVASWKQSPEYRGWARLTQVTYGGVAEKLRARDGDKLVAHMETRHVQKLMAEKADTPTAANRVRKTIGMLMAHAIALGWRKDNPAREAKPYKVKGSGYHDWAEHEIARFFEVHRPGSAAHTAVTLMLYTGAARVDAVALGWGNIEGDRLRYTRRKTEGRTDIKVDIPIHAELAAVLDKLPMEAFTFLETRARKSRSPDGLGNLMREACDKAGLPDCTAHGLRKACARRLAEAGATPHEIAAVTGHATLSEVERYTRAAERGGLADAGFAKMAERMNREQKVANHPARFAKSGRKILNINDKK